MKTLPKLICFFAFTLVLFTLQAQDSVIVDSTGTTPGTGGDIIDTIASKITPILFAVLGVYEVITRLVPTVKDFTLVNNVVKILQWILDKLVPNKTKEVK